MKILFLYDYIPFSSDAVGNLINNIAPYFKEKGNEVYIASTKSSYKQKKVIEFSSGKVLTVNYVMDKMLDKKCFIDFVHYYARRVKNRLIKKKEQGLFDKTRIKICSKFLNKIHKKYNFDVIIPICSNYLWLESAIIFKEKTQSNVKIALYQVDPFSENFNKKDFDTKVLESFEEKLYASCDVIFTTPIIYELKKKAGKRLEKLVPIELPGIVERIVTEAIKKEENEIRCIFSGFLYKAVRNPKFMLELFSNFENKNIKLYLIGAGCEDIVKEYQKGSLNGRLITLGKLGVEDNANWLNSANVLLNIGNLVENQVPSKIFNYFSTGKPIINICKIDNCSSKKYMDKYPLAINVKEVEDLTKDDCFKVENFILNSVGKTVNYATVEEIFYDCKPEYIVDKMLSKL